MSFLFGGRKARPNASDLPKQAKEQIIKLDGLVGPRVFGTRESSATSANMIAG